MRRSRYLSLGLALSFCLLSSRSQAESGRRSQFIAEPGRSSDSQAMVNPSRLSVQFEKHEQAVEAASRQGARYIHLPHISAYKGFACGYFEYATHARDSQDILERRAAVTAEAGVRYVGYDYRISTADTKEMPNDPQYGQLWGMPKISAPAGWDIHTDASDVIVMILDTGTHFTHPDLAPNVWANPEEIPDNGMDDDGNGYVDDVYGLDVHNGDTDPKDDNGHGSHCAGTIGAAGNDGVGIPGVAWGVKMAACKILGGDGSGEDSRVPECLEYMIDLKKRGHNITVSSNSWGADGHDPNIQAGFEAAGAERIIHACAAGNSSADNDNGSNPAYPASYDDPSIISVMSSDSSDARSGFSNYGKTTVDLAAPGSDIYSCSHTGSGYNSKSGTSMATPHVAGALALLSSYTKSDDVALLRSALLDNVDSVSGFANLCVTGGRLNLAKSLGAVEPGDDWGDSETGTGTDGTEDTDGSDDTTDDSTEDTTGDTGDETSDDDSSSTEPSEDDSSTDDESQSTSEESDDPTTDSEDDDEDESEDGNSDDDDDENSSPNPKNSGENPGCGCRQGHAQPPVWLGALAWFAWTWRRRRPLKG